jgi:prepilin-type processing-associated H-X9-DG protein
MKMERAGAFTVIELLAVTVVFGLLGILFLPVLARARADARNAICRENLRAIGKGVALYGADQNGKFPGTQHERPSWVEGLAGYCFVDRFVCGEYLIEQREKRVNWTYALNDFLTPHPYGARGLDFSRTGAVPRPSETMMFGEAAVEYRAYDHFHFADRIDNGFSVEAFGEQVDVERHDTAANYLFVDGRVEELGWSSGAKPKLKTSGSRFVHPAGESAGVPQMARR